MVLNLLLRKTLVKEKTKMGGLVFEEKWKFEEELIKGWWVGDCLERREKIFKWDLW